jgi:hypothetical protein
VLTILKNLLGFMLVLAHHPFTVGVPAGRILDYLS